MACQNWISVRCCDTDGAAMPAVMAAASKPPTHARSVLSMLPPLLDAALVDRPGPSPKSIGAEQVAHHRVQPAELVQHVEAGEAAADQPGALVVLGVLDGGNADGRRARRRARGLKPAPHGCRGGQALL